MQIDVIFTPCEMAEISLAGRGAAVIDVLRSTTSMVAALEAGCRDIIPCPGVEEATRLADTLGRDNVVLCGERDGNKINGFDLGNSPLEFTGTAVKNKTLLMSTTNGTVVISRAKQAAPLVAAAFVNAGASAGYLAKEGGDVVLICSGKLGRCAAEDILCAGLLVVRLEEALPGASLTDGARMAATMYKKEQRSVLRSLRTSQHGQYLASLGYQDDLKYACQLDISSTVPIWREGRMVRA
jgi:2-phosphosulfolactate phosphatase